MWINVNSPKFCMFYSSNYRYRLARLGCWSLLVQLIHLKLTCLKPGCSPLVNTWLGPGFRRGGVILWNETWKEKNPSKTAQQDCLLMKQYLLPYIPLPFAIPLDSKSLMLFCVCTFKLLVWNPAQLMVPNSQSMKLCEFCCDLKRHSNIIPNVCFMHKILPKWPYKSFSEQDLHLKRLLKKAVCVHWEG